MNAVPNPKASIGCGMMNARLMMHVPAPMTLGTYDGRRIILGSIVGALGPLCMGLCHELTGTAKRRGEGNKGIQHWTGQAAIFS
jgi:hypothetical protein